MIRFTKAKATPPKPKRPSGGKKAALDKLRSFLAQAEPDVVEILMSGFSAQQNTVTYKELREAYLAGGISQKQFEKWQADYTKLITGTLAPQWKAAAAAAAQEVKAKYPYFLYDPDTSAGMSFLRQHGAELVTNIVQEQRDALNAIIQHVSGYTNITPDEAARIIRPCVGLTKPQALANARYREAVKQAYLKAHPQGRPQTAEKRAAEAAARYAARQHCYRAQNIARTELAFAYNAGAYGATKDAQARGYIGDCVKVWLTAYDERVCPVCSAMDDEKRNMDESFSNGKLLPPAHPSCRCAVAYEEIPGTMLNPGMAGGLDNAPQQGTPSGVMGDYIRPDGSFDLDTALADYEKFLQSVPEKNRILLQAALGGAVYQQTSKPTKIFSYDPDTDTILFNPGHPFFHEYDFRVVNTHELGHRIDHFFIHSAKQACFLAAIQDAKAVFDKNPDLFIRFCERNDKEGFLSDIISAICKGKYKLPAGHDAAYWNSERQAKEIFANLIGLEAFEDSGKLAFLKDHFSDLLRSYHDLEFLL